MPAHAKKHKGWVLLAFHAVRKDIQIMTVIWDGASREDEALAIGKRRNELASFYTDRNNSRCAIDIFSPKRSLKLQQWLDKMGLPRADHDACIEKIMTEMAEALCSYGR